MYVRVYSPQGEMFEVNRERADQLLLQEGWTQTKPQNVEDINQSFPIARQKRVKSGD